MKKQYILFLFLFSSIFGKSQINSGMIANYPLNGNYNDLSISNVTGVNNGTTFGPDYNGSTNSALIFDGNSFVSVNNPSIKVPFPLSISVWATFDDFNTSRIIFASDNLYENYSGYLINTVGNQLAVNIGGNIGGANPSNRRTFLSDYPLQPNTWYHFSIIIRSATDMDVYVNCVKSTGVYSGTGPTNMSYSNTNSTIGYNEGNNANPGGYYHKGSIDHLIIWDREIDTSEILFLCDSSTTLGLKESQSSEELTFQFYPNPTSSKVKIDFQENSSGIIQVVTVDGKILIEEQFNNVSKKNINLQNFTPGVYIINIKTSQGKIITERIVKE